MNKRQLVALQCSILAIVGAILFPPFGYDRYVTMTIPSHSFDAIYTTNNVAWRCVGHGFIFGLSKPPYDEELHKQDMEAKKQTGADILLSNPEIKIAGHVLAAEIAVIALLTAGAYVTLGHKRRPKSEPHG